MANITYLRKVYKTDEDREKNIVSAVLIYYEGKRNSTAPRKLYQKSRGGMHCLFLDKNICYEIKEDALKNERNLINPEMIVCLGAYRKGSKGFDGFKREDEVVVKDSFEDENETEVDENGFVDYEENPEHPMQAKIEACISRKLPVYLWGEAGTGKNFILQKIANKMGLDFYYTNSVQEEYKITGFIDAAGDYHETEFYKAFKKGGLFFLDEMDASIPGVLVLLNAAIANGYFEFPNGRINAHDNFRVVAAGNTCGNGANETYTGRLVLDGASLDRFVFINLTYNYATELSITKGNKPLVDFVRGLREKSKKIGVRATFSYRCLTMVYELEQAKMDLNFIFEVAVFKGMDKDTVNQLLDRASNNRYNVEMCKYATKM